LAQEALGQVTCIEPALRNGLWYNEALLNPVFIPEYLAAFKIHRSSKTTSTGHKDIYVDEEKIVVGRYVRSRFQMSLHNVHRLMMTFAYSLMNRGR
jgi:hypothetical protein